MRVHVCVPICKYGIQQTTLFGKSFDVTNTTEKKTMHR